VDSNADKTMAKKIRAFDMVSVSRCIQRFVVCHYSALFYDFRDAILITR
jgi:hypothetical protein